MLSVKLVSLAHLQEVLTSHGTGSKKVFLSSEQLDNALTQIAFGELAAGEIVMSHVHQSMDEYFYFISGKGTYIVNGERLPLVPNVLVQIVHGLEHSLMAEEDLTFVYWGVAV